LRMLDGFAGGADAVACNENFTGREDRAGVNLKQAGGMENDRRERRLLRRGHPCEKQSRNYAQAEH